MEYEFKNCTNCNIKLDEINSARAGIQCGKPQFRKMCKPCWSKRVVLYQSSKPEKRRAYANYYARKIGRVKQYPCKTCGTLCYKKYAHAFCSDKCRFLNYVDKNGPNGCWLWVGPKNRRGYGKLCYKSNKTAIASRVSYEIFKGPIEHNKYICHSCDIPACVNPDHLWMGDHAENTMDMVEKGRQHSKLTPQDVIKIRHLFEKEGYSNQKLMHMFNLSCGTISNIIARRVWKHV